MFVIPAKAGTQRNKIWAPAFAGVTKLLVALVVALLALASPAAAQQVPDRPVTPVLDQAKILRPEQAIDIESKAEALHARTGRTFFVATVASLGGLTIEDYGNRLGRKWQAGGAEADDGVILIVAPAEKKVRIETGYGAEGFLPDILAGRIIRDTILPRFREGDLAGGTAAGANAVITQMAVGAEAAQANVAAAERARARQSDQVNFVPVLIIVVIFFAIIASIARGARGRRYRSRRRGGIDPWVVLWGLNEISRASRGGGSWGGGGGFGGFGGGGGGGGSFGSFGGGFGGGGASGSW